VRPDLESKLMEDDKLFNRITHLLMQRRESEANALIACNNLHKILEHCPDWHEASVATAWCAKMFLCERCATAKHRIRRYRYDHPYIYEHLLRNKFSVLTLMIEGETSDPTQARSRLEAAQQKFKQFTEIIGPDDGWILLVAFSWDQDDTEEWFQRVKFYAIHEGSKLPAWPTLNAQWKSLAGPDAHLKVKLFDDRDGDDAHKGLHQAFSGFEQFQETIEGISGWFELDVSQAFRNYDTITPYGKFRGFDGRVEKERIQVARENGEEPQPIDLCADAHEHEHPVTCGDCHKPLVSDLTHRMMSTTEILATGARLFFGHSRTRIYGQRGTKYKRPLPPTAIEVDIGPY
jgi:hypothetical protein